MAFSTINHLADWLKWIHKTVIEISVDLTDEQIAIQPGPAAPPVGWHVFHLARWADRLQATFKSEASRQGIIPGEIWAEAEMLHAWGLGGVDLGLFEAGTGMEVASSATVAHLGTQTLVEYARRAFSAVEDAVDNYNDNDLYQTRLSFFPDFEVMDGGGFLVNGDNEETVIWDINFYIIHASRHMGMIEALRGTLYEIAGTGTI